MNELKISLLSFFEKTKKYYNLEELRKEFKIKGEEQTNYLFNALKTLEEEGSLFFNEAKGYKYFSDSIDEFKYGKITISKNNFAWITTKNNEKIFIKMDSLNGAIDNDTVIVSDIINIKEKKYGKVFKILKRENSKVIFECVGNGLNSKLIPYSIRHNINIKIPNYIMKNLGDGDLVMMDVFKEKKDDYFYADVIQVIRKDDPDKLLKSIAFKNNIDIDFSKDAIHESSQIPTEVLKEDYKNRTDLTNKEIFTIDCDETKDMDDAIGIEINKFGNYIIYISIADVAHYVKEDSVLYSEALQRGTSVYMDNSCIPMLPHKLSNGICSLNPNVDRLARTSEIEITPTGNIIRFEKYDSVIRSRMKMKYSEVNKILEQNIELEEYKPFIKSLKLLDKISEQLETEKRNRDYIEFACNEIQIKRENEVISDITLRKNGKAEKLIENLMILANQLSAERYGYMPYLYRVHEAPDHNVIKEIVDMLKKAGYKLNSNNDYVTNKAINQILNEFRNKEEFSIISQIILQGMKRARYSSECIGHFALNLYYYSHTTSPIRRCIDLVINQYEKKYDKFEKENYIPSLKEINDLEKKFSEIAEYASIKERNADKAEDEANRVRTAEYIQNYIGETFSGIIYKISSKEIKVIINNTIKGSIIVDNIVGDVFSYDSHNYQLNGKHSKTKFKIGKEIEVTISSVNPLTGDIKLTTEIHNKVKTKTR